MTEQTKSNVVIAGSDEDGAAEMVENKTTSPVQDQEVASNIASGEILCEGVNGASDDTTEQYGACKTVTETSTADAVPFHDEQDQQNVDQNNPQLTDNHIQMQCSKRNRSLQPAKESSYVSATAAILGNTSDRNDFLPTHNVKSDLVTSNEVENGEGIINGVKKWFSSSVSADENEHDAHDYYRDTVDNIESAFQSSRILEKSRETKQVVRKKFSNDDNFNLSLLDADKDVEIGRPRSSTYDETAVRSKIHADELPLNERGDGESKFKYTNVGWSNKVRNKTDEVISVMSESSLFYDAMDNDENHSPSDKTRKNDREGRARRINPRAVAQAISSSARRQWTERRYKQKLKKSSFMWNNERHPQIKSKPAHTEESSPVLPTYELTTEHRQAFLAAHSALNVKLSNEYSRNKHAVNNAENGYDLDIDLDLNLTVGDNQQEEIRTDLTKSSLAIRGSGQIRLPIDNVRLIMDSHLQPGILSVESRAGGYMGYENYSNGNRYGNINAIEVGPLSSGFVEGKTTRKNKKSPRHYLPAESYAEKPWRRNELSYVLTVDDNLYKRLVQEISDSYRLPFGMYYCCHVVESESSHDHVGIGVAVSVLMIVFLFLVVGMLIWPMD